MKIERILLLFLSAVMLTGCNQTPSTIVIDNAPIETPQGQLSETEETIDVESLPIINMSYELVNETIMAGDKTITLNGYVGKPDSLEGLCTYYANMVEHEKYVDNMDFLFGDLLNQVDEDETGYKQLIMYDDIHEYPIYMAYLYNRVSTDDNAAIYVAQWVPLSGETIPVNMTVDEAIAKADEILEQIGVQGFTLEKVEYLDEVPMEGYWPNGDYYSVTYRKYLQGVPVVARTKTGGESGFAEVEIQERGIDSVVIKQLDFYAERQIDKCISYEEALEIFLNYVSKSSEYEDFNCESIAFEYAIKNNYVSGEYDFTVVPCWRFNVDINEPKDIIIEAENGNLTCIDNSNVLHFGSYDRLFGLGVK